jgi:hypothetical protein
VAKDLQAKDGTATIGEQITRMQRAIAAATAATAAGGALHGGEKNATAAEEKRMRAAFHAADNENSTVYHDKVPAPAELPEVEKKLIAKCLPAAPSEAPLKFEGLLPSSLVRRIEQHHAAAHERLHALSSAASEAAALAAQALRRHQLPEVLDACKADKRLPERLVAKIEQAKQKGDLAALTQKLERCERLAPASPPSSTQLARAPASSSDLVLARVGSRDLPRFSPGARPSSRTPRPRARWRTPCSTTW